MKNKKEESLKKILKQLGFTNAKSSTGHNTRWTHPNYPLIDFSINGLKAQDIVFYVWSAAQGCYAGALLEKFDRLKEMFNKFEEITDMLDSKSSKDY